MENGGRKRGMDRNGGWQTETGYGQKWRTKDRNGVQRETVVPETVVKGGNIDGVDRVMNGVDWKGRSVMECDGEAWNVMEGLEMVLE